MKELVLNEVEAGQVITMHAGEGDKAHRYEFTVQEIGRLPVGMLAQAGPDGSSISPQRAVLLGSGGWTTPQNNPMLRPDWFVGRPYREKGFSLGWGYLHVGGCVVVRDPQDNDALYELQPALTDIEVN